MKCLFLSNYFNHHQKSLADAMYELMGNDYHFIATSSMPNFRKELGYREQTAPYVLLYSNESRERIDRMVNEADVVIYGAAPLSMIKKRCLEGKLTFCYSESLYKSIYRYLKWPINAYKSFWLNRCYLLSASAYAPIDYMLSGMKLRKCFRWGYFTIVKKYNSINALKGEKRMRRHNAVSLLWVGRLIRWKHPEAALYVANRLKKDGLDFELKIIGSGSLEKKISKAISAQGLNDRVKMLGSMSTNEVRTNMENADIFLFTSDRQEGWGAVLNESMNSGCAVVADENIGSAKYLINPGKNGLIYKSQNYEDLYAKVKWLIEHPNETTKMGIEAYHTILNVWNGENAATNFMALSESLLKGETISPSKIGPCSNAPLIMRRYKGLFPFF